MKCVINFVYLHILLFIEIMRKFYIVFLSFFLLAFFSLKAQNTEGKEFYLTFGSNWGHTTPTGLSFYIRLVNGNSQTNATIYFNNIGTSRFLTIPANQALTYSLTENEKQAVYNSTTGISSKSIRITTDNPVNVYAMNQNYRSTDATHLLYVSDYKTDYYHISYTPYAYNSLRDAYAVIAVENDSKVYHNGNLAATLNAGQVYYRNSYADMTGSHITADKPVALFAMNEGIRIPLTWPPYSADCLMQQMMPVQTWGKNFFVPVSYLSKDRVRIVASQSNTTITQIGGTLISGTGGQASLNNLKAGQFVELEVYLSNNGCYIQADKPVGVCTFLTSKAYNDFETSDPAQCWLPPIEQTINETLIAPFIPSGENSALNEHYALIITPTATKNNTQVSIGGTSSINLTGGSWRDNGAAGMSFYTMPLKNETASYRFTNEKGLIILCYGTGPYESYYYLAGSSLREFTNATLFANNIHYQMLPSHLFCVKKIDFRAEIEGLNSSQGSLKWYINGVEEASAQDKLTWNKTFAAGAYEVKMWVRFKNEETETLTSTINIGGIISTTASPPEGGTATGDGCFKVGDQTSVVATPAENYLFTNWTENGNLVSSNSLYTFTVSNDRSLTANFRMTHPDSLDFDTYAVIICNRVILLNLKKLADDGFEVTHCKWFKNGKEMPKTHTINAFSFSEGPDKELETAPNYYSFRLVTSNFGELPSTEKIIIHPDKAPKCPEIESYNPLTVYPNPIIKGGLLTLEGLMPQKTVYVYNHIGETVLSFTATESSMKLTFDFPQGIYLVRNDGKIVKVVIVQ